MSGAWCVLLYHKWEVRVRRDGVRLRCARCDITFAEAHPLPKGRR